MIDTISQVQEQVVDTVLLKSDVAAFYADMMDKQATQFTIILTVIGLVFAVAIGATWWWNYKGAKQQISDEVNTAKQSLNKLFNAHKKGLEKTLQTYESKFDGFKGTLQKSVNNQIEETIKATLSKNVEEFKQKVTEIDKKNTDQVNAMQQKTMEDISAQKAEICRIFALYCTSSMSYLSAVGWWVEAVKNYALVKDEKWVGISCDGLKSLLEKIDIEKIDVANADQDYTEDIKKVEQYVPLSRLADKKYILKRLNELNNRLQKK